MHCNPLTDPGCVVSNVVQSVTSGATSDVLSGIAQAISAGVRWVVTNTATWWVRIPSPNLAAEPAVTRIQQWLLPITAAIAVGGVIAAGARMALTRRASPLLDITGGLLTVALASTLGVAAATLLLKAGDAWSAWILQVSTGGQFTQRLNLVLQLGGGTAAAVMLVFGLIAIVLSLVQAVLMLFRQAALLILAGVLPLAAAGSIAPMTRTWVRKVTAWMLALICYKPAAAAVYAAAFTLIGTGRSPRTVLMGFVMLLLSVLTLPALMKFFTWTTGSIGSPGGGGGGQLLGAATFGAIAVGAMRSAGAGAAQGQAAHIDSSLGPPPSGSGPDSPPGGPPPGPDSGGSQSGPAGGPFTGPAGASPGGPGGRPAWPSAGPGAGWSPWGGSATGSGGASAPSGGNEGTAAGPAATGGAASAGAAAGAASGAGAAATVTTEAAKAATRGGRLAGGAMGPGDRS